MCVSHDSSTWMNSDEWHAYINISTNTEMIDSSMISSSYLSSIHLCGKEPDGPDVPLHGSWAALRRRARWDNPSSYLAAVSHQQLSRVWRWFATGCMTLILWLIYESNITNHHQVFQDPQCIRDSALPLSSHWLFERPTSALWPRRVTGLQALGLLSCNDGIQARSGSENISIPSLAVS